MLEVVNRTPFKVGVYPGMDKDGYDYAAVVVKGTFDIGNHQELPVSQEQVPIAEADEHFGEPGVSSVKYESDTCYTKKGTDVVLVGHAYAKGGSARVIEVKLKAGHLNKRVRVFGDRMWCRALGAWRSTDPRPFDTMPLVYERAFGGEDKAHPNPSKHGLEQRNPVGTGFAVLGRKERLEELPLPNLEDPADLIGGWGDKPRPAGFGFIGRNWVPRTEYAGTYEEGSLRITVPVFDQHWTAEGTCYWEGRIQVENTGAEDKSDVIIRSSLIDVDTGTKDDIKSKTFQKISGHDTLSFIVRLYGECDRNYTIQVETFVD